MSEIKWIKICTDIFDDEKILLIESKPEKDSIIVIWFKLLCFAGKQNNSGVFIINDKIAYTDEMLATIFRRPLDIVKSALDVFEQYGMIEIIDGTITIPNWEKHQNLDALERYREGNRQRVAKHRNKQKNIIKSCNVTGNVKDNVTVTLCNATDKKEDIDKKEDKNNTCLNSENLDESFSESCKIIKIKLSDAEEHIYSCYPRKEGKTEGLRLIRKYLKGRKLAELGTVQFNHEQLYCAVLDYQFDCEDNNTEKKYIQMFSTFMDKTVIDYIEKSEKGYKNYMRRTYGDDWINIKFEYE